jgi:uncharacterized protein YoxC
MAINPAILLATAFAALVVVMGALANRTKRNTEELEQNRKELQASVYETNRTISSIERLVTAIEKLNSLPFLTREQHDELQSLGEQLEELFGEEAPQFIARRADGSID